MNQPSLSPRSAAVLLFLATLAVYSPSCSFEFVRLDDYQYVVDNPLIRDPSIESLRRVFSEITAPSTVAGYYQPLSMASLMLDAWLHPTITPDPAPFHRTNVLLHAVCAVLAFTLLRQMLGGLWGPLILAALFALHPVQVESVAWISQRKTVLSGALALGSLNCYVSHARTNRFAWLAASIFLYGIACLAKPSVIPLPLILFFLDVWQLGRPMSKAFLQKWPFVAVMLLFAWIAVRSQAGSSANFAIPSISAALDLLTLSLYNIVLYAGNLLRPTRLSPYRPVPSDLRIADPVILIGLFVLAAAALLCRRYGRRHPAPFASLLSALVLLTPAVGIVRYDETCVADRFLYLPLLFVLLACGHIARQIPVARTTVPAAVAAFATVLACVALNLRQQAVWRNSMSLWSHVARVAPDLTKARYELAFLLIEKDPQQAIEHARRCVEAAPNEARYHLLLARALMYDSASREAASEARAAIALGLGDQASWAYLALAEALLLSDEDAAAAEAVEQAIQLGRPAAGSYASLGHAALRRANRPDLAAPYLRKAASLDPTNPQIRELLQQAEQARNHTTPQ